MSSSRSYSVEFVRELPRSPAGADQALVRGADGRYFVASSVVVPWTGPETLVFSADEHGQITEWLEVAGGRGMTREQAIADLATHGPAEVE